MPSSIEERIVQLGFNNAQFEKGAAQSLKTLDKLDAGLRMRDGLSGLEGIENALTKIADRFSVTGIIGDQVLRNLTNKVMGVVDWFGKMAKSMSLDQINAGFSKYEEKTKAVQTIMSATASDVGTIFTDQAEQMENVSAQLEKLNWFTDETSYSFLDMVNNIGKFTSNGIKLEDAVVEMQGISTWAALSGASIGEAGRAMYNLSQALAVGSVKLMDWKSIENANMATKEFKETALETAVEVGTLTKTVDKAGKTMYKTKSGKEFSATQFNTQLSEGWFSSEVLEKTLQQYGKFSDQLNQTITELAENGIGDFTATELLNELEKFENHQQVDSNLIPYLQDLSKEEYDLGKRAFKAAQEAKTFTDAIDATKDAVSTTWMNIFETMFGNYLQAKEFWTDVAESLYNIFAEPLNSLSEIIDVAFGEDKNQGLIDFQKTLKQSGHNTQEFKDNLASLGTVDINSLEQEYGSFNQALEAGAITADDYYKAVQKTLIGAGHTEQQFNNALDSILKEKYGKDAGVRALVKDFGSVDEAIANGAVSAENYIAAIDKMNGKGKELTADQKKAYTELFENYQQYYDDILAGSEKSISGREFFTGGILNTLNLIENAVSIVGEAIEEVFGTTEQRGEALKGLLERFNQFTERLKNNYDLIRVVKAAFVTLFSAIKSIASGIGKVVGGFTKILGIGINFVGRLTSVLLKRGVFSNFGTAFKNVLEGLLAPLKVFGDLYDKVIGKLTDRKSRNNAMGGSIRFFTNLSEKVLKASESFRDFMTNSGRLEKLRNIFSSLGSLASTIWSALKGVLDKLREFGASIVDFFKNLNLMSAITGAFDKVTTWISTAFTKLRETMKNPFGKDGGFSISDAINKIVTAFLGFKVAKGVGGIIKSILDSFKFFGDIKEKIENFPETIEKISEAIGNIKKGGLKSLLVGDGSGDSTAKDIMTIAISVAVLAVSMALLASIDANALGNAIFAMVTGLGSLIGVLKGLEFIKAGSDTTNLIKIAGALLILSLAFKIMAGISFGELAVGLVGILGALAMMLGFLYAMDKLEIKTSKIIGIISLAIALVIFAAAVRIFATMNWDELARGTIAAVIGMAAMALVLQVLSETASGGKMLAAGAAMIGIAVALVVLAAAVLIFGKMKPETLEQGLMGLAVGLGAMVIALALLSTFANPGSMLAAAAAILVISAAMVVMAVAIGALALVTKNPDSILTFVIVLGAMAAVLAILSPMALGALGVAAAMLILGIALVAVAASFAILAVGLRILQGIEIGKIALQLLALIIPLMLLGVAGVIFGLGGVGLALGAAGLIVLSIAMRMLDKVGVAKLALQLPLLATALMLLGVAGIVFGLGAIGLILGGAGLVLIATALSTMNGVPVAGLSLQLLVLAPALILLGVAGLIFGLGAAGLMLGGLGLIPLAQGLQAMSNVDIDAGKMAGVAAGLLIFGLAGVALTAGVIGLIAGSAALAAFSGVLPTLADGINSMASVSWDTIGLAFGVLATSIGALLVLEFATLRDGTGALLNLANAMPAIADGFNSLAGLDSATMETATSAMKRSISSLFRLQFATFADGTAQLKSLAEAMPGIAEGLNKLSVLDAQGIKTSFDALKQSVNTLIKLEFADSANTTELLYGLGTAFPVFASGVVSLMNLDPSSLSIIFETVSNSIMTLSGIDSGSLLVTVAALQSFGTAVINMSAGLRGIPEDAGSKLASALDIGDISIGEGIAESLNAISEAINATSSAVVNLGTGIILNLVSGILAGAANITSAMTTISMRIQNSAKSIQTTMPSYGYNIARGIAIGLNTGTGIVVAAMYTMAYNMKEELKRVWGIHSPSTVGQELAAWIPVGMAKGIESKTSVVNESLSEMSDGMIMAIAPALGVFSDIADGTYDSYPSITPVVDAASVQSFMNSPGLTPVGVNSTVSHRLDGITSEALVNNKNYANDLKQLIAINTELLESSKAGGNVYLSDGVIAGMVNRRLGVL